MSDPSLPCVYCNGKSTIARYLQISCSENCYNGKRPAASNCAACQGTMSACNTCMPVWPADQTAHRLLSNGYQLGPCPNCQERGRGMKLCQAYYHQAYIDRSPVTCRRCGGTFENPNQVQAFCVHDELRRTRPCPRPNGGLCFYDESSCEVCTGTEIEGGRSEDCPDC